MSIINSQPLIGASGQGGYFLTKSLRFRSSASAYLNRTPASAGNRKTFTFSTWIKLGEIAASNGTVFSAGTSSGESTRFYLRYTGSQFQTGYGSQNLDTTVAVFRDPSAWYHLVLTVDTTQATAANRLKIYVNGVQQSVTTSVNFTQNVDTAVNNTVAHNICREAAISTGYVDGYLAEVNFIDGQALTPSSFGETSTSTGVWIPKKYTGTYGTNGFYLPFTDVATTSGSNAGLGKDFSGNGNYWTTNNISVTSGSTYDSMKDVPTLTDTDTANYCVANPLGILGNSNVTIAGGNLDVTIGVAGGWRSTQASTFAIPSTGKWYFEVTQNNATSGGNCAIGILQSGVTYTGNYYFFVNAYGFAYINDGTKGNNNSTPAYGSSWTSAGDNIGVAIDMSAGTLTFYKNGVSQGSAYTFDTTREYFVMLAGASSVPQYSINYGQRPFAYTPPTGFKALNTYNLPTPTIGATASTQANKYFDALTYTGNGSASQRTDISFANMQPDFVWIKNRTSANNHVLHDDVRGTAYALQSNLTNATDGPVGFGNDGFGFDGVGNQLRIFTSDGRYNTNGNAYVTWGWKGSGAAGVTNTAGSITSTVSANTTAGFSIVTWTGNGTAGATVGHGLGVAPSMVIAKRRSAASNWSVSATAIGATKVLFLEQTAAAATDNGPFNSTLPSSTVITLGSSTDTNASGGTFVAYCFAQVAGYSAFGSYTGNGSSDGTFVYTGFRPRYVMAKVSSTTGPWNIFDSARGTYNVNTPDLWANSSNAETGNNIDFLSNGFKVRDGGGDMNGSGSTYIYMAFAESPFKYSLAR